MVADLSTHHHPLTDLFPSIPRNRDEWEKYRLTDDQVEHFHQYGYVSDIPMLDEQQVEALREELKDMLDPKSGAAALFHEYNSNESKDPSKVLFHALGAWRVGQAFHDLLWNPRFTMAASQLLGGSVRFWHDQLFCKPANHGAVVAWHQDYSYWTRTQPMAHLTCWIGLDDSTVDNGCLCYIPKSHRWPLLPVTGLAGNMDAIQTVLSPEQKKQFKEVKIEMKKGHASFHHPLMVHGSYENKTDRPRRATVLNVFADGVRSATDDELLAGVPVIKKNEKMRGQFFPLLYDNADDQTNVMRR
ncbi:hypothetical protein BH09SUM1_BH09SUM1_21190 [soil metagenome]